MIDLIFETHASSEDNGIGLASGHCDSPLSAVGEQQAVKLGRRYSSVVLSRVFCSDLQRSYRTAEIAFSSRINVAVHKDPRLRECDYGTLSRTDAARLVTARVNYVEVPFPQGESYTSCVSRVRSFLRDLVLQEGEERILVIGHRATHFALEHLLNGRTLQDVVSETWSWQPGWSYRVGAC